MTDRNLLDSQIDETAEHNDMVPLLLGLWKVLHDASTQVEVLANSQQGIATTADKVVLLALLGLLSLRSTLNHWLCQGEGSQPQSFEFPVVETSAGRLSR